MNGPKRLYPNPQVKKLVLAPKKVTPATRGFGAKASLRQHETYKWGKVWEGK